VVVVGDVGKGRLSAGLDGPLGQVGLASTVRREVPQSPPVHHPATVITGRPVLLEPVLRAVCPDGARCPVISGDLPARQTRPWLASALYTRWITYPAVCALVPPPAPDPALPPMAAITTAAVMLHPAIFISGGPELSSGGPIYALATTDPVTVPVDTVLWLDEESAV